VVVSGFICEQGALLGIIDSLSLLIISRRASCF
jgi:hypothetical protein